MGRFCERARDFPDHTEPFKGETDYDPGTVTNAERVEQPSGETDYYEVSNENGEESMFSAGYWKWIEEVADASGSEIKAGENEPATICLRTGRMLCLLRECRKKISNDPPHTPFPVSLQP